MLCLLGVFDELIPKVIRRVCGLKLGSEAGGIRPRGIEDGGWFEGQGVTERKPRRLIPGRLGGKEKDLSQHLVFLFFWGALSSSPWYTLKAIASTSCLWS